jgi:hypothetical protein
VAGGEQQHVRAGHVAVGVVDVAGERQFLVDTEFAGEPFQVVAFGSLPDDDGSNVRRKVSKSFWASRLPIPSTTSYSSSSIQRCWAASHACARISSTGIGLCRTDTFSSGTSSSSTTLRAAPSETATNWPARSLNSVASLCTSRSFGGSYIPTVLWTVGTTVASDPERTCATRHTSLAYSICANTISGDRRRKYETSFGTAAPTPTTGIFGVPRSTTVTASWTSPTNVPS